MTSARWTSKPNILLTKQSHRHLPSPLFSQASFKFCIVTFLKTLKPGVSPILLHKRSINCISKVKILYLYLYICHTMIKRKTTNPKQKNLLILIFLLLNLFLLLISLCLLSFQFAFYLPLLVPIRIQNSLFSVMRLARLMTSKNICKNG